jgi:oligoribonuclease NrnB/cAMP/cGMP phosphodiesterase (DHH superfamily)
MSKLTQEEIQQIKELQTRYNQTILEIGAAEAQLIVFQENIEKLTEAKKGLVSDLKTIEQKESELVKTLQEKYGQGSINIETGEITPAQ